MRRDQQWSETTTIVTRSRTLAAEAAREREVLRLNCDTLGVDRGEVGVLEEGDEISLGGLLKRHDGRRLEAEVGLHACTSSAPTSGQGERGVPP
jgi:hypothetical protein